MLKLYGLRREELLKDDNPFAVALLIIITEMEIGKLPDNQIITLCKEIAHNILERRLGERIREALFVFLYYYMHFGNEKMLHKFEKEIASIIHKNKDMVTLSFRQQCINKADKLEKLVDNIAKRLVKEKMSLDKVSEITQLPLSEIKKLAKE